MAVGRLGWWLPLVGPQEPRHDAAVEAAREFDRGTATRDVAQVNGATDEGGGGGGGEPRLRVRGGRGAEEEEGACCKDRRSGPGPPPRCAATTTNHLVTQWEPDAACFGADEGVLGTSAGVLRSKDRPSDPESAPNEPSATLCGFDYTVLLYTHAIGGPGWLIV